MSASSASLNTNLPKELLESLSELNKNHEENVQKLLNSYQKQQSQPPKISNPPAISIFTSNTKSFDPKSTTYENASIVPIGSLQKRKSSLLQNFENHQKDRRQSQNQPMSPSSITSETGSFIVHPGLDDSNKLQVKTLLDQNQNIVDPSNSSHPKRRNSYLNGSSLVQEMNKEKNTLSPIQNSMPVSATTGNLLGISFCSNQWLIKNYDGMLQLLFVYHNIFRHYCK